MVSIKKNLVSSSNYSIKCPYSLDPKYITIHNTANDASAANEVAYMIRNGNEVSFHFAVDDIEAVQGIPTNRNAWHAGDGGSGNGNRKSLSVEICYSKSGGSKFDKAYKNSLELVAKLMKDYSIPASNIFYHKHWSGKYCPHRLLDNGVSESDYRKLAQDKYDELYGNSASTSSGETYKLVTACKIYMNADNAKNRKSSVGTYSAGTYYVYNESNGMINITKTKGVAGGWINPGDNKTSSSSGSSTSTKYKVGDTVKLKGLYTSSDGTGYTTKIAISSGKITKILSGKKAPYLINDGAGWANDSCIGSATTSQTTVSYYKKYTGSSSSLVDALKAIGVDSSYSNREKIAKKNGISNYSGTASQNEKLLSLLKQGKLKK